MAPHQPFDLPPFSSDTPENVTVVIETSKGSRNKLGFDPEIGAMRLKHVLPEGASFPFDFGFIPRTRGGDGDPLDVLVFLDEPLPAGTVLDVRLIGVVEARQRDGDEVVENNRYLGVPVAARSSTHVHTLDDLRPGLIDEVEAFFQHYNAQRGIDFVLLGRGGPKRAVALVRQGVLAGRQEV